MIFQPSCIYLLYRYVIKIINKPLNGYFRQRNRSGDSTSKIGKATILEIEATIPTFSIKFENVSPAL